MKKNLMIAAVLVAMLGLASCHGQQSKDDTPACWELNVVYKVEMFGMSEKLFEATNYLYGSEAEAAAELKKMSSNEEYKLPGVKVEATKKKLDKSESDCVL